MGDREQDWKEENIYSIKQSLDSFSNNGKLNREKWVVKQLLLSLHIDFKEEEISEAEEPADVSFRNAKFQIKEMLDKGRRRTDEYKVALNKAEKAEKPSEMLEHYPLIDISFSDVVNLCHTNAKKLISSSKYGYRELKDIDLLYYFNWKKHYVVKSNNVQGEVLDFRSLSVVSNYFCGVVYATTGTPEFLKDNVGKVVEFLK